VKRCIHCGEWPIYLVTDDEARATLTELGYREYVRGQRENLAYLKAHGKFEWEKPWDRHSCTPLREQQCKVAEA
jgi:hypothetical protein